MVRLPPNFYWKRFSPKMVWGNRYKWADGSTEWIDWIISLEDVTELPDDPDQFMGTCLLLVGIDPDTGVRSGFMVIFTESNETSPISSRDFLLKWIMKCHEHEMWEWVQIDGAQVYDPHSNQDPPLKFECQPRSGDA